MRVLALAAICFTLLGVASAADAATPVKGAAPGHLHGFLLRADEPVADAFPRTPSFAWDPVPSAGADMYQIWLIVINNPTAKMEMSLTNVLDEREFYTFHRSANWTGTIRWRIRALRMDNDPSARQNHLPAVAYGPWSPVYTSTNPAYSTGPITLGHTVSDVIANGDGSSAAHRLMPGFTFSGDTALHD